jgi:hypothetical protein
MEEGYLEDIQKEQSHENRRNEKKITIRPGKERKRDPRYLND